MAAGLACDTAPRSAGHPDSATGDASTLALAESLYAAGAHESAGPLFQVVLNAARERTDEPAEARVLTWLGLNAYRLGESDQARRLGREALQLKLRLGLKEDLFASYNALGLLAYQESRYIDAVSNHEQAKRLAEEAADTVNLSKAWNNLALTLIELGDYRQARELLRRALPAARKAGDTRIEGRVLTNLGMLAVRTGALSGVVDSLREARRVAARAGDYLNELNALGQLASAFSAIGEPGSAIATLDTMLVLSRDPDRGSKLEEASALEQLAQVYESAGDDRRALAVLQQAIAIEEAMGWPHERAVALRQMASVHARLGNQELAGRVAVEALTAHREIDAKLEVVWDLVVLAELRHRAGRVEDARTHLAEARQLARALRSSSAQATVVLSEAWFADAEGDANDVLRLTRDAGEIAGAVGPDREWEVYLLVARAHRRLGHLDAALSSARQSLDAVERIRGEFGAGILRTAYVADRTAVYGELAELLIEGGRSAEAFEVADAARGRALLEHLETTSGAGAVTPRELIEEQRQLLKQVDALTELAAAGEDREIDGEAARTRALLERTRAAYGELLARSGRRTSGETPGRLAFDSLQAALNADEVLLEYLVTESGVLAFAVTRVAVAVAKTDLARGDLAGRARVARELAGRPDAPPAAVRATLAALGALLLGQSPIRAALTGKRVIMVVPHAELVYVPFAALVNPATGRWLSDDHAVVHLPSAAILATLRGRRASHTAAFSAAFAPFPRELPFTAAEVRAVRASAASTRVFSGQAATESRLRSALVSGGAVHVASHGILNRINPLFSRIDLARRSASSEDDGRFEVHEVLGLAMRSGLVYLSGCETGAGPSMSTAFDRGEDYATLAQAFLVAGATNVVATLWKVRDDGAAEFARRFYSALGGPATAGGRHDLAHALASAQRGLRSDPRFAAPYYWAAYVMNGTGWLNGASPAVPSAGSGLGAAQDFSGPSVSSGEVGVSRASR